MGPTKTLLVLVLLTGCHEKYVPPPDGAVDPSDASPLGDAGTVDAALPPDLSIAATVDLLPPPDLEPDLKPPPAVPGGSITTPPLCTAGTELALTSGDAIDGFTWLWDVDHYVVVYSMNGDLYARRWNADGTPVGPSALIEATLPASTQPSIARFAGGYVVAWEEAGTPRGVRLHQLDASAQPTGSGIPIASSSAAEVRPSLTHAPGGLALAFIDSEQGVTTVRAGLLDSGLSLVAAPTRFGTTAADASYPVLVGDDLSLALIWSDGRDGQFDPRIAVLDSLLGTTSEVALRSNQPGDGLLPRSIRTTFGYLTAWEDSRTGDNEIRMALTDTQGGMIASGIVEEPDTGDANWPNLAWSGVGAAAVYYQFRTGAPQIYLSYVDASGKRIGGGADVQVSHAPAGRARFPDVKWTGDEFGVAWIDTRSQTGQLYFNRVTCK
jgi:hypothetical protein